MPVAVALALRAIIQFAITLGATELAERFILPPVNAALAAIAEFFGVPDDVAQDIFVNEFLVFLEEIGIGAALIRTKLPLAVANRLGLTSKGFVPRKIPTAAPAAPKVTLPPAGALAPAVKKIEQITSADVKARGEQAAAEMRALLAKIEIDEKIAGTKVSNKTIQKLQAFFTAHDGAAALAAIGVLGTLVAAINKMTASKGVVFTTTPDGESGVNVTINGKTAPLETADVALGGQPTTATEKKEAPAKEKIKVFTGIISAGTLGAAVEFEPRPDDLIKSTDELTDAARNNLSSWLTGLLGRIIYEIKIVPSVITKTGTMIHGRTSQIVSGYSASGKPRHRNVVNRFAVMEMFILNDKGTRVKIAQITLGPTDATTFRPTPDQVSAAVASVAGTIATTNTADIKIIASSAPVAVITPPTATPPVTGASAPVTPTPTPVVSTPTPVQTTGTPTTAAEVISPPTGAPSAAELQHAKICRSQTLAEFYEALGAQLPPLTQRGESYQTFNLGQAALYTGTAEQNTRLLRTFQARNGC